ncbi:MAG TPA: DUF4157 domain-containing protein [Saprospiraceae bacterium]|nr:DUF4157 domain-containing protein [Saprospiraceae bacterium]
MERLRTKQAQPRGQPQQQSSGPFFGGMFIQPKLTINIPGDKYEREADAMVDQVMRKTDAGSAQGQYFFVPANSAVQRKCAACEHEEELQRKEEHSDESALRSETELALPIDNGNSNVVQRSLIDCSSFTKKEEDIDAEDAKAIGEVQGGGGADQPEEDIQRKCKNCEDEEIKTQRSENGRGGNVDPSFERSMRTSKGGGSPLPNDTRSFMEDQFSADFNDVRIHNDSGSAQMSSQINAHAFTHGSDIYFNSGQYNPGNEGGKQLLAHELTHVVQQTGSQVQRKRKASISASDLQVQRSFYFAPNPNSSGTAIHKVVLSQFVKSNQDLFIEVSIPGANKMDVEKGKTGIADFYKGSTTIGVKFDTEPANLKRDSDFEAGKTAHPKGAGFDHADDSAPKGVKKSPHVERMGQAASNIQIGDLKPGASSESVLGEGQVTNYINGITNTQTSLNAYLAANPTESKDGVKSWTSIPTQMKSLDIPNDLRYTQGTGIKNFKDRPLALYKAGNTRPYLPDAGLRGTLYVYKDPRDGVWSYEWIPDNVPASTGSKDVNQVLDRLNTKVIPDLTASQGAFITPKRAPLGTYTIMRAPQAKTQKFSDEEWKKKLYTPWKKDATKVLGNKTEVKKAEVAVGIVDIEKRSKMKVNAPEAVKEQGAGLSKMRHWKRFGGFYGWLREKFDWLYVKVKGLVDKVKKKVQDLSKKAGSTSFGSWIKAVAKVVFKIFKMVGSWVVSQVLDKVLNSLREGVMNNVRKLVEKAIPDDAKVYLEKFCALQSKYDNIINQKEDELITLLFGDKLKLFEAAEAIEEKIGYVADIATLIEWGIRLLACASPPAIGCLWNLAIEALKWIFAKLIQTCWFTKEVYAPVINKVNLVKQFPSELASGLTTMLNGYLPVPDGLDPWFAPVKVDLSEFKVDCNEAADGSASLTPERKVIMDIVKEEGGDEKLKAALELMMKRGAGPWVLLDKDRLDKLMKALKTTEAKEMQEAAKDKEKPVPTGMGELIGDIGKYTGAEKKLIAEAKAAKEKKAALDKLTKEVEEILNDPKAKEALEKAYPSNEDLKKDLVKVPWDSMDNGTGDFFSVNGHTLIALKTSAGARTGAFFKYFEKDIKGVKSNLILETSKFYALDTIPKNDCVSFSMREKEGNLGIAFLCLKGQDAGTFSGDATTFFFAKIISLTNVP